eukprot:TRINITY_DN24_c0_g1_i1.p1 TRINITY_DN24_c0_g1~~TRINITY_DN24_c0_g1_i1.p1  ORF type:complete len:772 (+),score=147.93 TRINITY_DN24_c0_g1_i1:84-2399(+)
MADLSAADALQSRVMSLLAASEEAPKPSVHLVWPDGQRPEGEPLSESESDEQLWEEILVKFGASHAPSATAALHFTHIIEANMSLDCMPFPQVYLTDKLRKCTPLQVCEVKPGTEYQDEIPFPLMQELGDAEGVMTESEAEAVHMMIANHVKDPEELRLAFYFEKPLDMDLVPLPMMPDGVIAADECTSLQLQIWEQRAQRGPLSDRALKKWRDNVLNPRFFEEIRPELEREASLLEMRARWARDKAEEARLKDELAEQGSLVTVWPEEGHWPPLPRAWIRHAEHFKRWRARPLPPCGLSMKRNNSTSSLNSWLSVSDISWVEVESKASADSWEVVLDEQTSNLTASLDDVVLCKADIVELKSMAKPPASVVLTMEVICVLLGQSPIRQASGQLDYWQPSKLLLEDMRFLDRLIALRHTLPANVLDAVAPYMSRVDFSPQTVQKSSLACRSLCLWARAVYNHHVLRHAAAEAVRKEIAQKPVSELLVDSNAAASSLSKAGIGELKAFAKPPAGVETVCGCLLHMFASISPSIEVTESGAAKDFSWRGVQRFFSTPEAAIQNLKDFPDFIQMGRVPQKNIEKVRKIIRNAGPNFTPECLQQKSAVAVNLCSWVLNAVAYYDRVASQCCQQNQDQHPACIHEPGPALESTDLKISRHDITELKSLSKPPQIVKELLVAVSILLGGEEKLDWRGCKMMVADVQFLKKLVSLNVANIPPRCLIQAKAMVQLHSLNPGNVRRISAAAAGLAAWVLQVLELAKKSHSTNSGIQEGFP